MSLLRPQEPISRVRFVGRLAICVLIGIPAIVRLATDSTAMRILDAVLLALDVGLIIVTVVSYRNQPQPRGGDGDEQPMPQGNAPRSTF